MGPLEGTAVRSLVSIGLKSEQRLGLAQAFVISGFKLSTVSLASTCAVSLRTLLVRGARMLVAAASLVKTCRNASLQDSARTG
jgi:hypothetical protein